MPTFDLTPRQIAIIESMNGAGGGELSRLFEGGCRLRNNDGFPARAYLMGHALREIRNRLHDYFAIDTTPTVDELTDTMKAQNVVKKAANQKDWAELVRPSLKPISEDEIAAARTVPIPRELAIELDGAFLYEAAVPGKLRRRLVRFLATLQTNPVLSGVDDIADTLKDMPAERHAHLPAPKEVRDESETMELWDRFERLMFGVFGPRHEVYDTIQRDLDELNEFNS